MNRTYLTIYAALCLGAAAAAQSAPAPVGSPSGVDKPSVPPLQQHKDRYTIQPQDVLALSFPLSPELNQTVTVQPDGYITLQGVPSIQVTGLTTPEAVTALETKYSAILKHPIIAVDIKDFRRPLFAVLGQVGKPGRYELRDNTTVTEALAVAGGMIPSAKGTVFLFHVNSTGQYTVAKIDMKSAFSGKALPDNALLRAGDMLIVPESSISSFRKYVPYSVGATYLSSGSTY